MPASGGQWIIQKDEATAGQRTIVFQLTTSNLTTPLTSAPTSSTSSVYVSINGAAQSVVAAPISTVSANAGLYSVAFPQAGVATLGNYAVYWVGGYSQFLGNVTVVNDNIFSSFSNMGAKDYSSSVTVGVGIATPSKVTVQVSANNDKTGYALAAGDFSSSVTVGVGIAAPSKVTVQVSANNDKTGYALTAGDFSSSITVGVGIAAPSKVTVQVSANNDKTGYTIAPGAYSTVTFDAREVATNLDKTGYTIANGAYSAVTFDARQVGTNLDKSGYAITAGDYSSTVTFGAGTIKPATYSGVTVGTNNMGVGAILATSFAAGAIDGIALAQSAAQEVADCTLLRALSTGTDTGRTVQDALRALRNRNDIETGVLTVYQEDDITSAWTATVSTAAGNPINQIDPA